MTSFGYENKICIVTGGAGGLGLEIAKGFLASGANVIVTDIVQERLDECPQSLPKEHQERLLAVKADVTSVEEMEGVFETAVKKWGRVDVVVNNAGITDLFAPVGDMTKEVLEKLIAVNTIAPAMISGIAVRQMLKQEPAGGVILNVGSAASNHGYRAGEYFVSFCTCICPYRSYLTDSIVNRNCIYHQQTWYHWPNAEHSRFLWDERYP
jgi:NAD(P)-dependent dehydrogenase (short-subunit alcohol dehydrogenase family)